MTPQRWMAWQTRICWVLLYAWILDWVPWYAPHFAGMASLIFWSQWKLRTLRAEKLS